MNKEEARKKLHEIIAIRDEAEAIVDMIADLKRRMGPAGLPSQTISDGIHGSRNEDTYGQLANLTALYDQEGIKKAELVELMTWALSIINRIENSQSRTFLIRHYINGETFEQLAVSYDRTFKTVKRWHAIALKRFLQKCP